MIPARLINVAADAILRAAEHPLPKPADYLAEVALEAVFQSIYVMPAVALDEEDVPGWAHGWNDLLFTLRGIRAEPHIDV